MVSSGRGKNIKTRKIASDLSGLENERKQGGAIGFTIGLTLKIGQTRGVTIGLTIGLKIGLKIGLEICQTRGLTRLI